jgi:hypothetical protein
MEFLKIWALTILAAVLYGLVHDQITIRVCPEYFTVYHQDIGLSDNLTLLALAWGVIATWWMGAILGLPLALVSRAGSLPKFSARQLLKPVGVLLGVMGISALIAGFYGYYQPGASIFGNDLTEMNHRRFTADLFAHNISYFIGAWGVLVLCAWVWAMRRAQRRRDFTGSADL